MRVLIDECVDWRLSRDILGHDVKTARQMGWATLKYGELLALAVQQGVFFSWERRPHSAFLRKLKVDVSTGPSLGPPILEAPTALGISAGITLKSLLCSSAKLRGDLDDS